MCKKLFLSGLLIFCLLVYFHQTSEAQKRGRIKHSSSKSRSKKSKDPFTQTQWWIGAKFGTTLTQASPINRYSTFSPTIGNYSLDYNKSYQDFKNMSYMSGLVITFFHKGFSASIQPNYGRQQFSYTNSYIWLDEENENNRLELTYAQDHKLDYLDIPLFIKYDILQTTFRPYVQIGGYYATLINATKYLSVNGTDFATGAANPFESEEITTDAKDLFINSSLGLTGGVGFNWDIGNIRIAMDVNYRLGMHNITNAANRYRNNSLASIGDAMDDLKLRNYQVALHVLFPMRFLEKKSFKAVD